MATWDPQANEVFLQALEVLSPAERRAYLDQVCAGNANLRGRVDELLSAAFAAGSFLECSPAASAPTLEYTGLEGPGTQIGPYKLLEQIGEGGFGVVYMAEQQKPLRRKVALKILKPGMDTRQVIARFEAERQALALMDHPNIARVLDAGAVGVPALAGSSTDEDRLRAGLQPGRPYFVMELVRGRKITELCDQHRLDIRKRLELFITICQAVQHAHQKGIIHRDLKPSNVLVTLHDGKPVAKVIDFGIAKAVGQQLTDKTLFTHFDQMIGTPLYMSPEQAELSGLDIDTRSDIYSLGVLLYELLTGQTPFDPETVRKAAFDEMRRIIREDEPLRPSQRLSTLNAAVLSSVSQHRGLDERHLGKMVRGDLDWIVMKCLEKDRARRYESAGGLAADIRRLLNDEPVEASPPSSLYRIRKFVCRHKSRVAGWGFTLALLAAFSLYQVWMNSQRVALHRFRDQGVLNSLAKIRMFLEAGDFEQAGQRATETKMLAIQQYPPDRGAYGPCLVLERVCTSVILLQQAEAAQQAYILTGNDAELHRYQMAVDHLQAAPRGLLLQLPPDCVPTSYNEFSKQLYANDLGSSHSTKLAARVAALMKISEFDEIIHVRQREGFDAARDVAKNGQRIAMEEVRRLHLTHAVVDFALFYDKSGLPEEAAKWRRLLPR